MKPEQALYPEKNEQEPQETRIFEYTNERGEMIRATVHITTESSSEMKEKLKTRLLETGASDFWAGELAHMCFPGPESQTIQTLTLSTGDGTTIDVLDDCGLKGKKVYVGDHLFHSAMDGYDGIFVPVPKTPIHLFILAHENGHTQQLRDRVFMSSIAVLSREETRRTESPYSHALEVDANQRGLAQFRRWKEMGIDLTGRYTIDKSEIIFAENSQYEPLPDSDTMTVDEFIAWQQKSRGI